MSVHTKNDRHIKKYILDPQFQGKLLSYFVGLFVITTASLYSVSYLFFWRIKDKAMKVGIPENHVFYRFIDGQKADLDMLFIALVIFNLFLLLGTGVVISHRIAGPIYRFKQHLKTINSDSKVFKLRQKDFFKDMENVINDLKDKMK